MWGDLKTSFGGLISNIFVNNIVNAEELKKNSEPINIRQINELKDALGQTKSLVKDLDSIVHAQEDSEQVLNPWHDMVINLIIYFYLVYNIQYD